MERPNIWESAGTETNLGNGPAEECNSGLAFLTGVAISCLAGVALLKKRERDQDKRAAAQAEEVAQRQELQIDMAYMLGRGGDPDALERIAYSEPERIAELRANHDAWDLYRYGLPTTAPNTREGKKSLSAMLARAKMQQRAADRLAAAKEEQAAYQRRAQQQAGIPPTIVSTGSQPRPGNDQAALAAFWESKRKK